MVAIFAIATPSAVKRENTVLGQGAGMHEDLAMTPVSDPATLRAIRPDIGVRAAQASADTRAIENSTR